MIDLRIASRFSKAYALLFLVFAVGVLVAGFLAAAIQTHAAWLVVVGVILAIPMAWVGLASVRARIELSGEVLIHVILRRHQLRPCDVSRVGFYLGGSGMVSVSLWSVSGVRVVIPVVSRTTGQGMDLTQMDSFIDWLSTAAAPDLDSALGVLGIQRRSIADGRVANLTPLASVANPRLYGTSVIADLLSAVTPDSPR